MNADSSQTQNHGKGNKTQHFDCQPDRVQVFKGKQMNFEDVKCMMEMKMYG